MNFGLMRRRGDEADLERGGATEKMADPGEGMMIPVVAANFPCFLDRMTRLCGPVSEVAGRMPKHGRVEARQF